ncbi:MAG: NPCBM/NEW2 domain-containing protein [Planctomycetota bacterium]
MTCPARTFALAVVLWLAAAPALADQPHSVQLLDASEQAGTVVAIDDQSVRLRGQSGQAEIPLKDVATIQLGESIDLMGRGGERVVVTTSGDVLQADGLKLAVDGEQLQFDSAGLGKVQLDLGMIKRIYLSPGGISARAVEQRCRELKLTSESYDILVAQNKEGSWVGLEGVFRGIDSKQLIFRWREEDRKMDLTRVPVVRLVNPSADKADHQGVLTTTAGTELTFTKFSMDDKQVSLESPSLGAKTLPRAQVAGIDFASSRVVKLSEMDPEKKTEEGFFDQTYPYRKDLAVSGKQMRLDGQEYRTGLGLHSFSELTWNLNGAYSKLVALVGIDDAVRPRGQADLEIIVDGKTVVQTELKGTDKAQTIRVDLAGAKKLTIRVGFGADKLGAADHVNLANARLIK